MLNNHQPDNRAKLRSLMELHDLTSSACADLLGVSIFTINSWRSRNGNPMPDNMLELLEYKLSH